MSSKIKTPPMVPGALPLIGHALKFNKNRPEFLRKGYKRFGKIFGIKLGPKKTAVLVGPEYHRVFFGQTDKKLNIGKPYGFLKPIIGNVLFVAGHETYQNQRPIIYEPFRKEKMLGYISVMAEVIQKWLDKLGEQGEMNIVEEVQKVVKEIAGYTLMGKQFQDQVGSKFWDQYEYIGKAIDPILPSNLPLKRFRDRDRAKKVMAEILYPIIEERRANPETYDDYLQDIVTKKQVDGSLPDKEEILGLIIGLMFAGHETTAGQGAWTIIQLLQNTWYQHIVENEIQHNLPYGSLVDAPKLAGLKHIRWAVEETARMRPSADLVIRLAEEDLEIDGYIIPKGWLVIVAADVAHFLPELFKDPNKYDPYRFSPQRKEGSKELYSTVTFGGGQHKCAGMNFAKNEMQLITAMLFQQFDLELLTTEPKVEYGMGACHPMATLVRYKRKSVSKLVTQELMKEAIAGGCPHMAKMMQQNDAN